MTFNTNCYAFRLITSISVFALFVTFHAAAQVTITGTVISKEDKTGLPGVNVLEKGTRNGTTTDIDGTFSVDVADTKATLIFSFIGYQILEVPLNGRQHLDVRLKEDCNKDFFDSQHVVLYAVSGVANTPLGGQIEVASPWLYGGIVRGRYGLQSDLGGNKLESAGIQLAHYISNCDFDIDVGWNYRRLNYGDDLAARANSFEVDFNTGRVKLIGGYTHLSLNAGEYGSVNYSGALLGIGTWINMPLYPEAVARVGVYDGKVEYMAEVKGGHKHFSCFLRFYKLEDSTEVSIGVGAWIGYRIRRQKRE